MFVLKAFLIGYFVGIVVGKLENSSSTLTTSKGLENLNAMHFDFANVSACPCDSGICAKLSPILHSDGLCSEDADGGRWLVILRHKTEKTTAFRDGVWENYAAGFGASSVGSTSFWLGLRQVHRLTSTGKWQVLLKVKWDKFGNGSNDPLLGSTGYQIWDDFKVANESEGFKLAIGNLTKRINVPLKNLQVYSYEYNNGLEFSTTDKGPSQDCAKESVDGGAWWFGHCTYVCLTCDPSSRVKELWHGDGLVHIPSEFVMAIRVMN